MNQVTQRDTINDEHLGKDHEEQVRVAGGGADYMRRETLGELEAQDKQAQKLNKNNHKWTRTRRYNNVNTV